jgi:alkylation response protein AidB-like acyl-CoA dehydrogenase
MSKTSIDPTHLLTDDMLARFDKRAAIFDRENRFLDEDWAELRDSGYLLAAVPTEFGGAGLSLSEVLKLQQRLGYHAAPSAVAVNMHIYWTGVAADLWRSGDTSLQWLLEEAANGEVFAALHGERGNDISLVYSSSTAERADDGWKINGHKIFGSLSPVWTYAGFHAMDSSDPSARRIVHGFVHRSTPGVEIIDTWDTLGMRATQSNDTILRDVIVPDGRCPLVCPAGLGGAGPFHVSVFAWALLGFAAVYSGAARRAFDLTIEQLPTRTSVALTHTMAHHPEAQHHVADMRIALDAADALLHATARDWTDGVAHPDWPIRIIGTRHFVINQAFAIVDRAMDLSGGAGAFKRNRLEQIFRDVRMGRFHPTNDMLTHELIGKLSLGIDPDDTQRWG